jgi:NAD(P)-dependent dehydrogenase (short-subunit alcohol dehydrogenase family)
MSAQRGGRSASRWILLTGASGGIGRATATRLADAGQVVFAAARRANALEELAATHPGIHPVSLDVSDQAAIDRARQQIMAETAGHGLDVLVNAAGILVLGPVEAASDALRLELAPFGVRVVLVQPGVVDTPLYARAAAAVNGDEEALQRYRAVWPGGVGVPRAAAAGGRVGGRHRRHPRQRGVGAQPAPTLSAWGAQPPQHPAADHVADPVGGSGQDVDRRRGVLGPPAAPAPTAPPPPSSRSSNQEGADAKGQAGEPVRRPRYERRRDGEGRRTHANVRRN